MMAIEGDRAEDRRIQELQLRYVSALDGKDIAGWLGCFANRPDASYVFTTRESVEAGLPVAMMLDDCRARLEDRVTFITKIWNGTFQDYQMRHFVQQVSAQKSDELWRVRSNFRVECVPNGRDQRIETVCGVYEDLIDARAEAAVIVARKVITDVSVLPRYLVYPI